MIVQTDLKDMVTYNLAVCPCDNCKVLSLNKPSLTDIMSWVQDDCWTEINTSYGF